MHWFDILIVVIVICSLIKGFMGGLIKQVASLAGLIIGAIFAGALSSSVEPKISSLFGLESHIAAPLSFLIAFLLIYIVLVLVGRILHKFVTAIQLGFINRLAGSVFCAVKWLMIVSILLNIVVRLDSSKTIIKEDTRQNSQLYPPIKNLVTYIVPYLRFDKHVETISETEKPDLPYFAL